VLRCSSILGVTVHSLSLTGLFFLVAGCQARPAEMLLASCASSRARAL
jgi:hypothetical protein